MFKLLIPAFGLIFSSIAFSQIISSELCGMADKSSCCSFNVDQNATSISRLQTLDQSSCAMGVVLDSPGNRYRRFGFGSDGQVSIYIQTSAAKGANSTQSFLIYPFGENPTVNLGSAIGSANNFEIDSGSGHKWTINSMTSLPTALEDCVINVSTSFTLSNSGVSISSCQKHLVVTTPIEVGGEYIAYPEKPLTIRDPKGKSCAITTSDLYNYTEKGPKNTKDGLGRYYNIKLKYSTNADMARALRRKCPSLDTSVLAPPRPPLNLNLDDLVDPAEDEQD